MSAPRHPIAALKEALRLHLLAVPEIAARLGTAVFTSSRRGLKPPYIVMGNASGQDKGTVEAEAMLVEFEIQIVTPERGTLDALEILAELEVALRAPVPPLEAHRLALLETRQLSVRQSPDTTTTRASLRLRALIEPL